MNNGNPGMNNENPGINNDGMNNVPYYENSYYENSYYDAQQPIEQPKKNSSGKTVAVGAASFVGGAAAGAAAGAVANNIDNDPIVIEPVEEPDPVPNPGDEVAKADSDSHHHHHHHRHHSHHSHHSSHHHSSHGDQHLHIHNDEIHNTHIHVPGENVTVIQHPEDPNIIPNVIPTDPMANVVPGVTPYEPYEPYEPGPEPLIEPRQDPYYATNYEDSVNDSDPDDYVAQASDHEDPYSGGAYDAYAGGEDYGFDSYNDADPMV